MMLKARAIEWSKRLSQFLRAEVEDVEQDIDYTTMLGMFHSPSTRALVHKRQEWARLLGELHELEEELGTLVDEWWNGPKMEDEPTIGDPGTLGYMLACMRDGKERVHQEQVETHDRWEVEQRNEHWTRRKEGAAQRADPNRDFAVYTTNERQLDQRLDCSTARREAA